MSTRKKMEGMVEDMIQGFGRDFEPAAQDHSDVRDLIRARAGLVRESISTQTEELAEGTLEAMVDDLAKKVAVEQLKEDIELIPVDVTEAMAGMKATSTTKTVPGTGVKFKVTLEIL